MPPRNPICKQDASTPSSTHDRGRGPDCLPITPCCPATTSPESANKTEGARHATWVIEHADRQDTDTRSVRARCHRSPAALISHHRSGLLRRRDVPFATGFEQLVGPLNNRRSRSPERAGQEDTGRNGTPARLVDVAPHTDPNTRQQEVEQHGAYEGEDSGKKWDGKERRERKKARRKGDEEWE